MNASPPAAAHAHDAPATCPNCEARLAAVAPPPRYCPQCGQETRLHAPSVAEFAHEFIGHYVALEGPLWRTLALLVRRPGGLTAEYLAGRRRRYVLPLRLYLSASFLFFLVLKFAALEPPPHADPHAAAAPPAAASAASGAASAGDRVYIITARGVQVASGADAVRVTRERLVACDSPGGEACSWIERQTSLASERWMADPRAAQSAFFSHALAVAPYAVFLMLPVFAAVVGLAYRNRRLAFGEHTVFALHMHAFFFLAAALAVLLPGFFGDWLFLLAVGYGALALRRVYGGRWSWTLLRGLFVGTVYGALLSVVTGLMSLWFFIH